MIKQDGVLRFENLSQFSSLIHGFSTKIFGDLRPSHPQYHESLKKFTEALEISTDRLVRMDQVHSSIVSAASEIDCGQIIAKSDGIVTQDTNVYLGVITADCVPLLFYDSKIKIVAAVHAGWRGLFSEIIKVTVSDLVTKGSDPKDTVVGIGPSIRVCCYEVSEEFVKNFQQKFSDVEKFVERRNGKIYCNLQKIAKKQLEDAGVLAKNIEDGDYCTFTHEDVYSCRREGEGFGEMMGIIGIQK